MTPNQNGNVLVYILLAVALLAALTYAISRDNAGNQTSQLSAAQAELLADDLIVHATAAQMAVDQMTLWGLSYDDLHFDPPNHGNYSSDTSKQLYHPSGGGLNYIDATDKYFDTTLSIYGWFWMNLTNVEWSSSPDPDVIYTAIGINGDVCKKINKKLTGSETIPEMQNVTIQARFRHDYSSSEDFAISDCPDCDRRQSICMYRDHLDYYIFYNILGSR